MIVTTRKNLSQRQIKDRISIIITIIKTLIKTKAESIERKECPLWIPKIECSLYHQLYKPAGEGGGETRRFDAGICTCSCWIWEEGRRPVIGYCQDAARATAAHRRCKPRRWGHWRAPPRSSLLESSLSEVLNQSNMCRCRCCCWGGRRWRSTRRILWIICSRHR